jgi:hypothetical protein
MLKRIILSLSLILAMCLGAYAQSFYVMHIKGKLFHQGNGKEIMQGDVITPSDKIRFSDNTASAVLINTKTGRYTLKPNAGKSGSELNYVVSQVISPISQAAGLNTRGGINENTGTDVKDIAEYFGYGSFLFCDSSGSVLLNAAKWPIDPTHYFVYSYKYRGENVNKKVGWKNNTLLLEYKPLYTVKSEVIQLDSLPVVKLYYVNGSMDDSECVASFHPVFKQKEDIVNELRLVKKIYETDSSGDASIRMQLKAYISEVYGKCDAALLETLLKEAMK